MHIAARSWRWVDAWTEPDSRTCLRRACPPPCAAKQEGAGVNKSPDAEPSSWDTEGGGQGGGDRSLLVLRQPYHEALKDLSDKNVGLLGFISVRLIFFVAVLMRALPGCGCRYTHVRLNRYAELE